MKINKVYQTAYFFLIITAFLFINSCSKEDNKPEFTDTLNIKQNYSVKDITFLTFDGLKIWGKYYFIKSNSQVKEPVIILIHQFKSDKEQWKVNFINHLLMEGYKVITYDIRSHGKSDDAKVKLTELLTDKEQAPKDLEAVFSWVNSEKGIDSARIGVIGTSTGASLAIYSRYYLGAKTIIGISAGKSSFEGFTGIDERKMGMSFVGRKISSALFICGKFDGEIPGDMKFIMDNYIEPPKEIKFFETDKHGKDLLEQFPETTVLIKNWLKSYL